MKLHWAQAVRAVGLGLLAWLITRADWGQLHAYIAGANLHYLFIMPVFTVAMVAVRAWRWNRLLSVHGVAFSPCRAWTAYAAGVFLGVFTPGRLGDLAKALYARDERGLPWSQALAGAVLDRLFDVACMGLVALWALAHLGWMGDWGEGALSSGRGWALGGLFFAVGAGTWFAGRALLRSPSDRAPLGRLAAFLRRMGRQVGVLFRAAGKSALALTLLAYAIYFAQTICIAQALYLPLSAADVVASIALVGLASFLPLSVAGLGTREGLLALIMAHRAVPESLEAALAYSALFFAFCFAVPGLLGFACFWARPLSLQALRGSASREFNAGEDV